MTPEGIIGPIVGTGADLVPLPLPSLEHAREFIRASKAENTLRGYQSDWRAFCAWCEGHGVCPLPATAENIAAYIAECAGHLKPGSIQRRLNAIAEAHKAAGLDSPTHNAIVRNTLKGIRRTLGTAQSRKAAVQTDEIRTIGRRRHNGHTRSGTNPARIRRSVQTVGTGRAGR
jgi:hypothetical protein